MPLTPRSQQIVDYVLSLTPEEFTAFTEKLTWEQREHLDRLLEKTEEDLNGRDH